MIFDRYDPVLTGLSKEMTKELDKMTPEKRQFLLNYPMSLRKRSEMTPDKLEKEYSRYLKRNKLQ